MAKALKPAQMKMALDSFFGMDIWTQRKIGRQAGLKLYDELASDMPAFAGDFQAAKIWEKQAIKACKLQDQAMWDEATNEVKSILGRIKSAQIV